MSLPIGSMLQDDANQEDGSSAPIDSDEFPTRASKRSFHAAAADSTLYQSPEKRRKSGQSSQHTTPLRYVIAHKVLCHQHINHPKESELYEDTPRLFRGDDKTSALRGVNRMTHNILSSKFADENPDVGFVVIREYDCGAYHDAIRDRFIHIPTFGYMKDILRKINVQLSTSQLTVLTEDLPGAMLVAERVIPISETLSQAMSSIRNTFPSKFASAAGTLWAPYPDFYNARSILECDRIHELSFLTNELRVHTELLSDYIYSSSSQGYQIADNELCQGLVSKNHFDLLFRLEDVVVRSTSSGPVAYFVTRIENNRRGMIRLDCWSWEFDGRFYRKYRRWDISWPQSLEQVAINTFSVYPLRLDTTELHTRLRNRGNSFWGLRSRKLVEYNHPNADFESQPDSNRYMVDMNTYVKMHPESMDGRDTNREYGDGIEASDEPPDNSFLLLLPNTIRGFRLHDKKWKSLEVERIEPVNWSDETFDRRLVLKAQKKELIKALVTVHTTDRRVKMDIVEGKGRGLILLLHGGPGTGKTLTAESIAEYARRPLYRVTCGDIGTDPESVEKYLESVLYIGTLWGCVVLLDEADVFLEERVPTDLQRNALVSVFLRTLEYFEGILVLTSNRVGTFDEAFKSRVQLAMHYPPLDEHGRWQVWEMLLKDLLGAEERLKYDEVMDKLRFLARHELNGRQIRNTINTARQLARYRKTDLAYEHLEVALDVVNEFELYVNKTRGHTDEEYAKVQGHR